MKVFITPTSHVLGSDVAVSHMTAAGWTLLESPEGADLVIAYRESEIQDYAGDVPHVLLHNTCEPHSTYDVPRPHQINGTEVHSFSLPLGFLRDTWQYFLWSGRLPLASPDQSHRNRAAMVTTSDARKLRNVTERLTDIRYALGASGHARGLVDLYGQGWDPFPVVNEASFPESDAGHGGLKHGILANYSFDFCLEDAHLEGFVTQRFWEAIRAGCLPVYLGSSWLDRIFPDHSYLDLRDFDGHEQLLATMESMPAQEIADRVSSLQRSLTELEAENVGSQAATVERWTTDVISHMNAVYDAESIHTSKWKDSAHG